MSKEAYTNVLLKEAYESVNRDRPYIPTPYTLHPQRTIYDKGTLRQRAAQASSEDNLTLELQSIAHILESQSPSTFAI